MPSLAQQPPPTTTDTWTYQSERVALFPYWDKPGSPYPEDFLAGLYLKCKKDGVLQLVFAGMEGIRLNHFIRHLSEKPLVVGFIRSEEGRFDATKPVGFGWLWGVEGEGREKKASLGFSFFREYVGTQEIRDITRLALAWWFIELDIAILYGTTLAKNRPAIAFAREFGFRSVGDLPRFFYQDGKLVDGHMFVLSREEFLDQESST